MFGILARSGYCFNLSILECKSSANSLSSPLLLSFNLSILECKYKQHEGWQERRTVLIYPYWNVNNIKYNASVVLQLSFNLSILECKYVVEPVATWCPSGFNLSILECKSSTFVCYMDDQTVLIYPYWNVN